jgi:hypothetical protein
MRYLLALGLAFLLAWQAVAAETIVRTSVGSRDSTTAGGLATITLGGPEFASDSSWLLVGLARTGVTSTVTQVVHGDSQLTLLSSVSGGGMVLGLWGKKYVGAGETGAVVVEFGAANKPVAAAMWAASYRGVYATDVSKTLAGEYVTAASGNTASTTKDHSLVVGVVATVGDSTNGALSGMTAGASDSSGTAIRCYEGYAYSTTSAVKAVSKAMLSAPLGVGRAFTAICYTFKAVENPWEVVPAVGVGGSVSPSASHAVDYETTHDFIATPATGYRLKHWLLDQRVSTSCPGPLTYSLYVNQPHYLTAIFEKAPPANQPSPSGHGKRW